MPNERFFSIIIPVYNVEKYIHECVESVLKQTFRDFEVILVDDGSTDNCPQICDEYERKDQRVQVIHKINGGVSEARNYGIYEAGGKYLLFLDSDDYWDDADALNKIYKEIMENNESADIVIFQAKLLYPDGTYIADNGRFVNSFNQMEPLEALRYMSTMGLLVGSACSKVVKKSFLIDNNLFFKVGIRSEEDIDWILRVANCLPKYQYTDQYFYIYRKGRSGSTTSNINYKGLLQFIDMLAEFTEYHYCNETVKECLLGYVAYEFSIVMAKAVTLNKGQEKKILYKKMKDMQNILNYDIHPKVRQVCLVKKVLGFRFTSILLGLYLKYRKR